MKKILIACLAIILIEMVYAVPFPNGFYGEAKFSNGTNIEGQISSEVNNKPTGSANIINGNYNLVVQSYVKDIISFYINGNFIGDIAFGYSGEVRKLDFILPGTNPQNNSSQNFTNQNSTIPISVNETEKRCGHTTGFLQFCDSNWKCSAWSECNGNMQKRNCRDENYCGLSYNKPVEEISCDMTMPSLIENKKFNLATLILGTNLILILGLVFVIVIGASKKRKNNQSKNSRNIYK